MLGSVLSLTLVFLANSTDRLAIGPILEAANMSCYLAEKAAAVIRVEANYVKLA
jgi:hypothetical protein